MKLKIDTTDTNNVYVTLIKGESSLVELTKQNQFGSEIVLETIAEALQQTKSDLSDLTEIEVNNHAGSYTGTRVGVSIANAFGYALQIPVNGRKLPKSQVEPSYSDH